MSESVTSDDQPPTLIVEFDRVLIDSEYALYRLWRDEFHGRDLLLTTETWARYRNTPTPAGGDATTDVAREALAGRLGLSVTDIDQLASRVISRHRASLPALPARPGIATWIRDAHHAGWRCTILAANNGTDVEGMLATLGLAGLVDTVLHALPEPRPPGNKARPGADQPVLPSHRSRRTVVATGSPTAILSARRAGYTCLAVPDKLNVHMLHPGPGVVVVDPELISFQRAVALAAATTTTPPSRARHRSDRIDRVRGSLTGLALGDALGKLVGYRTVDQHDAETAQVLDALRDGGEPPAVFTGRVTDDTVLALALADTILATGRVSRDAFQSCLTTINPQGGWQVFKLKNSPDQVIFAQDGHTNGCVPRSAVLAYRHTPDTIGDLIYDVLKIGTLTHRDPVALATAVLFAVAIMYAVDGYAPSETVGAVQALYRSVVQAVGGGQDACAMVHDCVSPAAESVTPAAYIDYLEDSVGLATAARSSAITGLCLGLTGWPADQVLPLLLRRRTLGDLDSTAAVYAALAGAFQPDRVPPRWTSRIEDFGSRSLRDLAGRLSN